MRKRYTPPPLLAAFARHKSGKRMRRYQAKLLRKKRARSYGVQARLDRRGIQ